VNNLYKEWSQYAIGGSMNPSVKSEANLFIAPKQNKEVKTLLIVHIKRTCYFITVRPQLGTYTNDMHVKQYTLYSHRSLGGRIATTSLGNFTQKEIFLKMGHLSFNPV
jgi:hypothetical protein